MKMESSNSSSVGINDLKNEANELFKNGNFEEAAALYTKALSICGTDDSSTACILHKNSAANYLKMEKYELALQECDQALQISPNDPKALYRRACSLEALGRLEEAYRDAQKALLSSPSDAKTFQPLLSRLHVQVEKRRSQFSQTKEKASRMLKLAFDEGGMGSASSEDPETGFNNLIVLCRDRAGIEALLELGILLKLKSYLELKSPTINDLKKKLSCVRILSEIIKHDANTCKRVVSDLGIPFLVSLQDIGLPLRSSATQKSLLDELLIALQYCWQKVIDSLTGMNSTKEGTGTSTGSAKTKRNDELLNANRGMIDTFLTTLTMSMNSHTIQAEARDVILQFFIKNFDPLTLAWGEQFVENGGLVRLLEVASEVPELKTESAMEFTLNTRNLISVLFSRVYDNLYYDKARDNFVNIIDNYIKQLLLEPDIEGKLRVTSILTCLLHGPIDVGNTFIGRPGILQMILVMANSESYVQQKIASEAIVAAASKKDKAKGILAEGINILKRLYQSKNDDIKVRALVGLCKLGSTGGTDAGWKPFAEGATLKLTEACRRFLLNPSKDLSVQRWAVEGLSYLTLDAEVKEKLVEDEEALKILLDVSKHATTMGEILFPMITCIVNLVNAYDKQEIIPEMLELAKFAKHHIPEEHEFDDPDFVDKRIEVLVELGVTNCLVNLSSATESANTLELIARILNAICEKADHRGMVVAGGGARELLRISTKATEKGQKLAAQALARIAISQPPSVAFPGQRSYEVVKPIISLLHVECPALQNFEALLALCNLAGESESLRIRILENDGLSKMEHYIYEEHAMLKRASIQCIVNLSLSERVQKAFEGENDRVKYMLLLCSPSDDLGDEDKEEILTMTAAASVLAIVSNGSRLVCGKILTCVKNSMEILIWLVANPLPDLQLRGVRIVSNILGADKAFAEQLVGTPLFEVLLALTHADGAGPSTSNPSPEDTKKRQEVKKNAEEALKIAENWGLIQKS